MSLICDKMVDCLCVSNSSVGIDRVVKVMCKPINFIFGGKAALEFNLVSVMGKYGDVCVNKIQYIVKYVLICV